MVVLGVGDAVKQEIFISCTIITFSFFAFFCEASMGSGQPEEKFAALDRCGALRGHL